MQTASVRYGGCTYHTILTVCVLVICAPPVVVLVDNKLNDEVDGDEVDGNEVDGEINDEVDDEDEIWFAQCVKVLLLYAACTSSAVSLTNTL